MTTEQIQANMLEQAYERERAEQPRDSGIRLITNRDFEAQLGVSPSTRKRLDRRHANDPDYPHAFSLGPGLRRRRADKADSFIEKLEAGSGP